MRLKFIPNTLTLAAALVAVASPSFAANADSDVGQISVEVQNVGITLTNGTALSFGRVLPFGRDGSVTIHPATGDTTSSSVHVAADGSNANWTVEGVPGAFYSITLPGNGAVSVTSGTNSMSLTNFTDSLSSGQQRLDSTGQGGFGVGATLQVEASQASGTYSGSYSVTVAYN